MYCSEGTRSSKALENLKEHPGILFYKIKFRQTLNWNIFLYSPTERLDNNHPECNLIPNVHSGRNKLCLRFPFQCLTMVFGCRLGLNLLFWLVPFCALNFLGNSIHSWSVSSNSFGTTVFICSLSLIPSLKQLISVIVNVPILSSKSRYYTVSHSTLLFSSWHPLLDPNASSFNGVSLMRCFADGAV